MTFADARTWTLALNTLLLTGAVCAISLPLGSALAWLLARTDLPGRRFGLTVLGLMLFVPLYLQAAAWQAGFGLQGWHTLMTGSPALLTGWIGAVWVHAVAAVPWVALIVSVGLRLVEPELEEQALLDGSAWQVFRHVTLRGAMPAVVVAALWVAITTAGEMTVTDLFAVRTYAEELYTRTAIGPEPGEGPLGAAPGVLLSVTLVAGGMLLCAMLAPRVRPLSLGPRWVFRLGHWRAPLAALVAAAMFLPLVGVPLGSLCYKAGVLVTQTETGRLRSWSAAKCLAMIVTSPWRYEREFGWTLLIAPLAATAAVVLALGLAWPARRGGLRAAPALLLSSLCLALPGPVIGLGLIHLLNRPEVPGLVYLYDRSILAPWLAMTIRGLPLATLTLWHGLRTVPPAMLEAAAVDGAGPLRRFWSIALPSRLPAVALAWVVALAVALGDLAASILVVPPGVATLSIRIFGLLHAGVEDQVAGICLAMILMFAAATGLAAWLAGRFAVPRAVASVTSPHGTGGDPDV